MPIQSAAPITIPPVPEKTFGHWWMETLQIHAPDPRGKVVAFASFKRYSGESGELSQEAEQVWSVDDLFALAAQSPEVSGLMEAVIQAVGALAKQQGVIS